MKDTCCMSMRVLPNVATSWVYFDDHIWV